MKYGKASQVMYTVISDSSGIYVPNTELSILELVTDYIKTLCEDNLNDRETIIWLKALMSRDDDTCADVAMTYISCMLDIELRLKI